MKKFLVLLVVIAMTAITSVAFAASDIAVSGSLYIRSRDFSTMDFDKNSGAAANTRDTQERVRLNIDAKTDNVKGRVAIENDWDTWGRVEEYQANNAGGTGPFLRLREAWIDFMLPGLPAGVKVGHQFLQLGQGWFFRSMKYGSDAWLVYAPMGNNTLAFVNVKAAENVAGAADDMDAYVVLDMLKLDDKNTVGIDVTNIVDRRGLYFNSLGMVTATEGNLMNVGLNYTGVLGPLNIKAEADFQGGKVKDGAGAGQDVKFKGNQIVVQGTMPMDPLTINFTLARGSGDKANSTSVDEKAMVPILDADPHYTFMYEYKLATICGAAHSGFCGTTAASVGADFAASKSLTVGANLWYLQSTEKSRDWSSTDPAATSNAIGTELDVRVNWKMYDNLSWNWNLGYFKPGDAMANHATRATDAATGIQGVLAYKF